MKVSHSARRAAEGPSPRSINVAEDCQCAPIGMAQKPLRERCDHRFGSEDRVAEGLQRKIVSFRRAGAITTEEKGDQAPEPSVRPKIHRRKAVARIDRTAKPIRADERPLMRRLIRVIAG